MVSSLHASVLGTSVPGISSATAVSSSTSSSTASSSTSVSSSYDSVSFSSTGQMMAAEGSHPPDFDSMSTEEFQEHLIELQEKMAANGTDTSSFIDPSTMTEEELLALKDEMSSMGSRGPQGKQGPPPPPPPAEETSVTEEEDETLDLLLSMLNNEEDDSDEDSSLLTDLLALQ